LLLFCLSALIAVLPRRAEFGQDELLYQGNDLACFLACGWLWPAQCQ
jgi:hypothetical protein